MKENGFLVCGVEVSKFGRKFCCKSIDVGKFIICENDGDKLLFWGKLKCASGDFGEKEICDTGVGWGEKLGIDIAWCVLKDGKTKGCPE